MTRKQRVSRRVFLETATIGTAVAIGAPRFSRSSEINDDAKQQIPLKVGIRAASMRMVGDLDVIKTAASIPGIMGVELQVTSGKLNLRDADIVRRYKKEADRWNIRIPSLSGVWDRGVTIQSPEAGKSLIKSIRAAEMLGSGVILVSFFRNNAPDMAREESYGPIVAMLQKTAKYAADAGVILGLENSLSPTDNKRLFDLVDHPAVGIYYDPHNMAYYDHAEQAIPGISLLGKERICRVHVKNEKRLLQEPGKINWPAAFREFNQIEYDGWYIYETAHENTADCIEDTKKNNPFLKKHVRMPKV